MKNKTEKEIKRYVWESACMEIENFLGVDDDYEDIAFDVEYLLHKLKNHDGPNWYINYEKEYNESGMTEEELQEFYENEVKVEDLKYHSLVKMIEQMHRGLQVHRGEVKADDEQ